MRASIKEKLHSLVADFKSNRSRSRVGQLDASVLDTEVFDLIEQRLWNGFDLLEPGIKDRHEDEIKLILKALIWKLTVWDHSATYGGLLQNLRFVDSRSGPKESIPTKLQKSLHGIVTVLGSYGWQRTDRIMTRHNWGESDDRFKGLAYGTFHTLDKIWNGLSLVNFILFLLGGYYSSLVYRILRLTERNASTSLSRQVNFEFLNRQLVWNALTEFLVFILPFLNIGKYRRRIERFFSTRKSNVDGEFATLPKSVCAICFKEADSFNPSAGLLSNCYINNPYETQECKHVYCYVCLQTKISEQEGDGWNCLRCRTLVSTSRPWIDIVNA